MSCTVTFYSSFILFYSILACFYLLFDLILLKLHLNAHFHIALCFFTLSFFLCNRKHFAMVLKGAIQINLCCLDPTILFWIMKVLLWHLERNKKSSDKLESYLTLNREHTAAVAAKSWSWTLRPLWKTYKNILNAVDPTESWLELNCVAAMEL